MFKTDFICVLTSGHTVDGREVKPETLTEMAESYDPTVYNARINIEHNQYGSKLGSVLALKVEDHGEQKKLFAQLKPNDYLLYMIQAGQKLHTSCEIVSDFAKSGKAYLTGLAVTDSPASLGTTEMHLSANGSQAQTFSSSEQIEHKKPNLLQNLFSNKEEDDMSDKATLELLAQIQAGQGETVVALTAMTEAVTKLSVKPEVAEPATKEEPAAEAEAVTALTAQVTELATALAATQKTLTDLTDKLSKQTDEERRDQATGDDGSNSEDVL